MMESDNAVPIDGTEGFNHNVDYLQPHIPREDTVVSDNVIVDGSESTEAAESNGCVSVFVKSDEGMMNGSSNGDMNDESITHVEHNGLTTTKVGVAIFKINLVGVMVYLVALSPLVLWCRKGGKVPIIQSNPYLKRVRARARMRNSKVPKVSLLVQ